jgi:DNA mismatch repair protein MutS
MALIKEYFDLTKKYCNEYGENTILLMQVGAFFEVYGILDKKTNNISNSQILEFSRICDLAVVEKNVCVGKDNVVMAGIKDIILEKNIKKIQEAGFTAVVYAQDENCKNTTRSLAGIFSPGTFFQEDSTSLSNNITCIWVDLFENKFLFKGKFVVVGIANIDIYTGKTSIFQFKEPYVNNPTTFDELERFISIYNPSEVIFISNLLDKEIDSIINYVDIKCSLIHKINTTTSTSPDKKDNLSTIRTKNCEKQTYQREILNKFYKIDDFDVFFQNFNENNIACQSFCFLLDFVYQHNPHLVNKISEPVFENCTDRLVLANHSLKQLNIIDDNNYSGKYSSVSKMLNECLTPMGKRKFLYNFLNPTTNIEYLQKEYNITEHLIINNSKYHTFFKQKLSEIKDISKWERQIFLKKISPKSFCTLYNNILVIRDIYDTVIQDSVLTEYLATYESNINNIRDFCNLLLNFIDSNIDIELAKDLDQTQQFETNFIKKTVDIDLDTKTETIKESEDKLESIRLYFSGLIENKEKKGKSKTKTNDFVKIHETEKNNFSLVCTNRRCKLLEEALPTSKTFVNLQYNSSYNNQNKDFEFKICKKDFEFHKQSAANNFITDEQINRLCKNISTIKVSLKEIITNVFYKFVDQFGEFKSQIESIINFVTLIDIVYSKASIAQKYNYCKPQIVQAEKSFIAAKNLRHCLIEHLQTNELYVTNDITIGKTCDGKEKTSNGKAGDGVDGVLLYGTNAVGKTSFIRSLGISLIMAQSGLFVPCSEFVYMPYNYIFTRILGNDNIFKGLSTFAVEMSELRTILRLADKNSLVLGDELCSGTENTSAVSIFVAGIQKLHQCRSSFIFATHLHEIINYEEITSLESVVLKHMAVVYDKERDLLVYDRKLKDGPGNSMYGLEVCKSLKLPDDFLNAAFNIRMKYHPEEGSMLSLKSSHFNSKKVMNLCEKCNKNVGKEVHHLQHQSEANENGIINKDGKVFHKNNVANLITLCEDCHNEIHKKNTQHKKVKTTKGYLVQEI